jgi:2-methylcitrate dehydratase PrpD
MPTEGLPVDSVSPIVDNIVRLRFEDIPSDVIDRTMLFIFDTIGTALAGSTAPGVSAVVDLMRCNGGKKEATIWCFGDRVPADAAAFANGVMAHARDFDDTHDAAIVHANTSVLPAAFSISEDLHKSGKELLTAVALGVDLSCRMGLAAPSLGGWIHSSTLGYFGSTAAASKLAGCSAGQISNALGIVYSQVAGNSQCLIEGALTKRMQPALGARAGVFSTRLAERGVTGPTRPLEGKYGFFNLYQQGNYSRERLLSNLGTHFEGINLSMKPYPCCRCTHAPIDTILDIIREVPIEKDNVDAITVYVPSVVMDFVGKPFDIGPSAQVSAQFSIPYTVATCIVKKDIFIEDFKDETVMNSPARELARRIKVVEVPNEENPKAFVPIRMDIKLKDGQTITREAHRIKGSPEYPMSTDEVVTKFKKCNQYAHRPLPSDRIEALIDQVLSLDGVEDVATLGTLLR